MTTENISTIVSMVPQKGKKYFSVAEANRALPYVSRIVTDVVECYMQVVEIRERIEQSQSDKALDLLQAEYEKSMDHLSSLLDELHQVGVELKDFEKGLLDFPALHEGREIYLCWQRGEQCVQAWHELDAGFAGRQEVSLLEDVSLLEEE